MELTVIGTGYVGLVTGACFADLGNNVFCIDNMPEKINKLKKGEITFYEPRLSEIVKDNLSRNRLHFTTSIKEGIAKASAIFIAVGTPSGPNGEADLTQVESVAREIAQHLDHHAVVVNKSTVPVGTGNFVEKLICENLANTCKVSVVSNPEFLREGAAVSDFMNPDRVVIGCDDKSSAEGIAQLYRPLSCPIIITDIQSAEMIKYSSNAFLATEISFINEIANICELVGADILQVVQGMGLDKRINPAFLNPGVGYGGSCFPKDTKALVNIAENAGYTFKILSAVIEVNDRQRFRVIDKLLKEVPDLHGRRIAIWGLSFKPNTDDIREAPARDVIEALLDLGANIIAYDPVAGENTRQVLPEIEYAQDSYGAVKDAHALIIMTEWNEFKQADVKKIKSLMAQPIIIDGRNIYNPQEMSSLGFTYQGIGR